MPSSKNARQGCWVHPDGREATVAALAKVMEPQIGLVVDEGTALYPSDDMATGHSAPHLEAFGDTLCGLATLDPRGAVLAQSDVELGLARSIRDAGKMKIWERMAVQLQVETRTLTTTVAYKIRVMTHHLRKMANQRGTNRLEHIYKYYRGDGAQAGAQPQQQREFTFFRHLDREDLQEEEESDEESADDDPQPNAEPVAPKTEQADPLEVEVADGGALTHLGEPMKKE